MAERIGPLAAVALLCLSGGAARAQSGPTVWVEAETDDRRRGLSWSEGRAALRAEAGAPLGSAFRIDAGVSTARGSDRHGGADAAIDVSASYARDLGALRLDAGLTGYAFSGATDAPGWVELGAGASFLYGPVELDARARYAPGQSAIGGDNLYLSLGARAGVPATALSVRAHLGRGTGDADDPIRAARLRPGGAYWDWLVGVEHVSGPLSVGLDYVGTDIGRAADPSRYADIPHARDTVVARVSYAF